MEVGLEVDDLSVVFHIESHAHCLVLEDDAELLAEHVQHLVVQPVELVQADPQPSHRHALQDPHHYLEAQRLGAVVDDAVLAAYPRDVLGRLTLARPCRADRRPTQRVPDSRQVNKLHSFGKIGQH